MNQPALTSETLQFLLAAGAALGSIAAVVATWAVLRHRVANVEASHAAMERRVLRLERWYERTIGAAAARSSGVPSIQHHPDTAPLDVVQPRHSEDSAP